MIPRLTIFLILTGFLSPALATPPPSDDGEPAVAALVPERVLAYAEVREAGPLVKRFLASDLRKRLETSDSYRAYQATPDYVKATLGLTYFQATVGRSLWDAIDVGASREVAIAFRPRPSGAGPTRLVLFRGGDAAASEEILQGLIRLAAAMSGGATPQTEERAGTTVTSFGERVCLARLGKTLAVSDDLDFRREAADLRASAAGGLHQTTSFRAARSSVPPGALGFVFTDLKQVAATRPNGRAIPDRFENVLGALFFADLAPALRAAPYAIATLSLESNGALIDVRVPGDGSKPAATPPARIPRVPRLLGTLSLNRDLTTLWRSRETLLETEALSGLAQFNTIMGVFFAGKQFGEDVLPEIASDLLFVSARQEWPAGEAAPAVKIPAFALVLHLRDAKRFGQRMEVAFQTTMGVVNADRGQKGLDPFSVRTTTEEGVDVTTARALPAASGSKPGPEANYTPSVALVGDRFIVSSTRTLGVDLVRAYLRGELDASPVADRLLLAAASIYEALHETEENLVAGEMLKKGSSRDEASRSIQMLLGLVRLFDAGEILPSSQAGFLGLRARVSLRPAE